MDSQRWRLIEDLYRAVLAREPGQRSALLDQADPEIRREVELMLAQEGSLLDRPAWTDLPDNTVTMLAAGKRLGRYEIEARLGAGGMGEVFRARDTRLNRTVALKVSKIQFSERFEREARAIAALNHPNICTLYDVGPNYLVMELVEGETLAARLKRGKLGIEATIQYGAQIAGALVLIEATATLEMTMEFSLPMSLPRVTIFSSLKTASTTIPESAVLCLRRIRRLARSGLSIMASITSRLTATMWRTMACK